MTEAESLELERLSHLQSKTPEALVHEAVAALLKQHDQEKRVVALAGVRGIWKDREDLEEVVGRSREKGKSTERQGA